MGIYNIEELEIPAIYNHTDKTVKCYPCIDQKDWDNLMEREIITFEKIKDTDFLYFCDKCKLNLRSMLKFEKTDTNSVT